MTLMEGWNAALEFLAQHRPRVRLSWGLPPPMTPHFAPDAAAVARNRRWTACKLWLATRLLRLFGLRAAAARLQAGFEALQTISGRTDKDLVFCAAALQALEAALPPAERHAFPLVLRPGMRLPGGGGEQGMLTMRRYFHTMLAAVLSKLYRMRVPQHSGGVDHDFAFVK